MSTRPAILIARDVFPEVVERLQAHFDVETTAPGVTRTAQELAQSL